LCKVGAKEILLSSDSEGLSCRKFSPSTEIVILSGDEESSHSEKEKVEGSPSEGKIMGFATKKKDESGMVLSQTDKPVLVPRGFFFSSQRAEEV
jgi:hypothetical protein